MLRSKIPRHIHITNEEKKRLLDLSRNLSNQSLKSGIKMVHLKTFFRSRREAIGHIPSPRIGRPRILSNLEQIIIQLAQDRLWGYTRILGELKKLTSYKISRNTVKNILIRNKLPIKPTPEHWKRFIARHWNTLWACDFFTKRVLTLGGFVDYYVLFFIHVSTRRVRVAGMTHCPDKAWMAQQARNLSMHFEDCGHKPSVIIHDRDIKFTSQFRSILESDNILTKRLPVRSPNLNAHAERWIQSIKSECLGKFVVFGEDHLRYLVKEYTDYYNSVRPHQGLDNNTIGSNNVLHLSEHIPKPSNICCDQFLCSTLKHYYLKAA
jgi:putative transposase